jgi:hypothetical protein
VNGLEIGAALTGGAALVTAIFGGIATIRQAGRDDTASERDLEERIRRIVSEEEDR